MKIKQLRSYYATEMRKLGLLSEQIDLMEGRIGKSIFLMHYFKDNPKTLSDQILSITPKLEQTLALPTHFYSQKLSTYKINMIRGKSKREIK